MYLSIIRYGSVNLIGRELHSGTKLSTPNSLLTKCKYNKTLTYSKLIQFQNNALSREFIQANASTHNQELI